MYHRVEVDFHLNLVKSSSFTMKSSNFWKKCHRFKVKEPSNHAHKVKLEPEKIMKNAWLYGPATELSTRKIIYPCNRFKCSIPCGCLLCAKQHPTCRVSSSTGCSCQDCSKQFADHTNFHATYHFGCKSCYQLVSLIPHFNFYFLDVEKKLLPTGCYDGNSPLSLMFSQPDHKLSVDFFEMWSIKRNNWKNGQEQAGDMWCKVCNILFWSLKDLKDHINRRHLVSKICWHHWQNTTKCDEFSVECYQCSKNFASVKDLQRHIDSVHYQDSHVCDICGKSFSREDNLRRHKVIKHRNCDDSNLSCEKCGKQFSRLDSLLRHERIMHSEIVRGDFQCDRCPSTFNMESNLTRHVESRFHKDGTYNHSCDQCDEIFCTAALLVEHSKSNHGEICGYKCGLCVKTFHSSFELKKHVSVGHQESLFKCDLCTQKFSKKGNLENHEIIMHKRHSFRLKCLICKSKFKNKFSLERHQEEFTMEGSPQHSCEVCFATFCTNKQLQAHTTSMHSSYSCDLCNQNFKNKSILNVHIKKRMGQPVCCESCGKTMCNNLSLRAHVKKEHP